MIIILYFYIEKILSLLCLLKDNQLHGQSDYVNYVGVRLKILFMNESWLPGISSFDLTNHSLGVKSER